MTADTSTISDPVESVPDPDTVRAEIRQSVRRTQVLRSLLKTAERKRLLFTTADRLPALVIRETKGDSRG
jgi:hypothetical protein